MLAVLAPPSSAVTARRRARTHTLGDTFSFCPRQTGRVKISFLFLAVAAQVSVVTLAALAQAPDAGFPSRAESFSGAKAGAEREVGGVKLCWCPPGKFIMGSPRREPDRRPDEEQVEVTLTKGFWMGKYEVTQGQWKRVIGKFPGERTVTAGEGDDFPVYWVNFDDVEG